MIKNVCTGVLVFLFFTFPLWAEDGLKTSTALTLQTSSLPEAKLGITQNFAFPLLQGDGPLTKDNNFSLALTAEVSPISVNGIAEAVLTPIAFLQAVAGGGIGSGCNINLFGGDVYGIGINRQASGSTEAEVSGSAFNSLLWNAYGGGVFQFDLAALLPGDWNHVVFRTYHEGRYKGSTAASDNDSWYFENDDGQNRNGFIYYGNFLLGYQMPIFLNTLGLMAEVEQYLRPFPGGEGWGDELPRWTLAGLFNFTITGRFSAALIVQFRTRRNYVEGKEDDIGSTVYYQERHLETAESWYLTFYRAAAILSYKLR